MPSVCNTVTCNTLTCNSPTARRRVVRLAVLALVVVGAILPQALRAQNPAPDRPYPGRWCGLAAAGGTVNMEISQDGRWVNSIEILNERGHVTSAEGTRTGRIQIVQNQFLYRAGGGAPSRCDRVPCRDGGAGNQVMIRGRFRGPEAVQGSFTAPNFGPGERRVVGNYIAWPAELAPCPY